MHQLCKTIGYEFKDSNLLNSALIHRSCGKPNNERLEFLGDSILNFVVAEYVFSFKSLTEGDMSRMRAALVREDALVKIASAIGLPSLIKFQKGARIQGELPAASIADAMEAVIAAVYLDGGLEAARGVIKIQLERAVRNKEVDLKKDPKTQLQEILQAAGHRLPVYSLLEKITPDRFLAQAEILCLNITTTGQGATRKQAEAAAAAKAIQQVRR